MRKTIAVSVVAACLTATGVAGTANAAADEISWEACAGEAFAGTDIRCAELPVPVDWRRPAGDRTPIGLAKLPAEDPEQRIGTLLVNLGGPGPTNELLPGHADSLSGLTRWFDVVGFDPRGIGSSGGVACPGTRPETSRFLLSEGRDEWHGLTQENRVWSTACWEAAGPLAGNLDSWQVAHDMEAVRAVLGEGGLTYYGNSYGTVYGQAYAELFPTRVHRMFLDSAMDHGERSVVQQATPSAGVVRDEFRRFGTWCEQDSDCALHPENARDVWDELMAKAREHPLPAPGAGPGKTVGPHQLRLGTLGMVTEPTRWVSFAKALADARAGDAGDLYPAPPPPSGDTSVAQLAFCSDFPFGRSWRGMVDGVERPLREVEPRVGWLMARAKHGRCTGVTQQGTFPPHRIDPEGLPPVLLVNGLGDQNTAPGAGRAVADQLPGSVWFGADSEHAVYLHGNRCVQDVAHRYLRAGDLPAPGRVCPAG